MLRLLSRKTRTIALREPSQRRRRVELETRSWGPGWGRHLKTRKVCITLYDGRFFRGWAAIWCDDMQVVGLKPKWLYFYTFGNRNV